MTKLRILASLVGLLLLADGGTASAYFNAPTTSPPTPVAGQPISMQIFGGDCDVFEDGPTDTDVTRVGQEVRITIDGFHADDPILCFDDAGTWTYPIGALPAGNYTLELIFRYAYPGGPILQSLGTVAFTVAAAQATPVPVAGRSGLAILALLVALTGSVLSRRD